MATLREVQLAWTTPSGLNTSSVLYFQTATTVDAMRSAINNGLSLIDQLCSTGTTCGVPLSGKLIEDTTGQQTGLWNSVTPYGFAGTDTEEPVPDAVQALARFDTGAIVNGRYVKGRCYVPGLTTSSMEGGNVTAGTRAAITNCFSTMASVGLTVYSRPRQSVWGSNHAVQAVDCWNEWAVLRRRRG